MLNCEIDSRRIIRRLRRYDSTAAKAFSNDISDDVSDVAITTLLTSFIALCFSIIFRHLSCFLRIHITTIINGMIFTTGS